jgi:serine/threonine-protein kinase HipA
MECHIQIFLEDAWRDSAVITVPSPELGGVNGRTVFEYDLEYVFGECNAPISLPFPVNTANQTLMHWPAFLYDLIPQGNGRKYLLGQLKLADDKTSDFALICAGAFNPIGHIRIREAVEYFQNHVAKHDTAGLDQGMTFDEIIVRGDAFTERMMIQSMLAAGTTGVQGAAPKYLFSRDHEALWHVDSALPDAQAAEHFIIKLPRGKEAVDKKLLRNEAAYMRVAHEMGLRIHGAVEHHNDMLFIPRFDRTVSHGKVLRHHQESAASIAGIVGFDARPTQFELLHAMRKVLTEKEADTIEFLKRDVLNLAMRNTDNHARNTAIQKIGSTVRLTPLFDFAPMYLDPEGIARAVRWYHPQTGKEVTNWRDVLDTLALSADEHNRIRAEMAAFGEKMVMLSDCMRRAGVDDDIIEYLQTGINEQIRQLSDLQPASIKKPKNNG